MLVPIRAPGEQLQECKTMTETIIMRGAYAITDPRLGPSGVIPAGAVAITDGTVRENGSFAAIAPKYPGARVVGDGRAQVRIFTRTLRASTPARVARDVHHR